MLERLRALWGQVRRRGIVRAMTPGIRPKGHFGIGGAGQAVWVPDVGEPTWTEMDDRWRRILLEEFDRAFIPLSSPPASSSGGATTEDLLRAARERYGG